MMVLPEEQKGEEEENDEKSGHVEISMDFVSRQSNDLHLDLGGDRVRLGDAGGRKDWTSCSAIGYR